MTQLKYLILLPIMALMAACATGPLGVDNDRLDTANKQLLAYAGEVAALATLTDELYDRGVVDGPTALRIADQLQQANDLLRSATESVARNGDPSQAEDAISRTQVLVGIALDLLVDFGLTESNLEPERTLAYVR